MGAGDEPCEGELLLPDANYVYRLSVTGAPSWLKELVIERIAVLRDGVMRPLSSRACVLEVNRGEAKQLSPVSCLESLVCTLVLDLEQKGRRAAEPYAQRVKTAALNDIQQRVFDGSPVLDRMRREISMLVGAVVDAIGDAEVHAGVEKRISEGWPWGGIRVLTTGVQWTVHRHILAGGTVYWLECHVDGRKVIAGKKISTTMADVELVHCSLTFLLDAVIGEFPLALQFMWPLMRASLHTR